MKIHAVGVEMFHEKRRTDRQTEMTEIIIAKGIKKAEPKKMPGYS